MASRRRIRLPGHWPKHVKAGVLHAISLAGVVLTYARGHIDARSQLRVQLDQAETEMALLREECQFSPYSAPRVFTIGGHPFSPNGGHSFSAIGGHFGDPVFADRGSGVFTHRGPAPRSCRLSV